MFQKFHAEFYDCLSLSNTGLSKVYIYMLALLKDNMHSCIYVLWITMEEYRISHGTLFFFSEHYLGIVCC